MLDEDTFNCCKNIEFSSVKDAIVENDKDTFYDSSDFFATVENKCETLDGNSKNLLIQDLLNHIDFIIKSLQDQVSSLKEQIKLLNKVHSLVLSGSSVTSQPEPMTCA